MCTAYQVTAEDVQFVLEAHRYNLTTRDIPLDHLAEQLFDELDGYAIERAALTGCTDLENQTRSANAEILRQLIASGHILESAA